MAVKIMDKENHARSNRVEVRSSDSFSCDGVEVKMGNHWYGARVVGRADDGFLVNYDYEKSSAPFFAPKNCVRRVSSPAAVEAAAKSLARFSWIDEERRAELAAEAAARAAGPVDSEACAAGAPLGAARGGFEAQRAAKERSAMQLAERAAATAAQSEREKKPRQNLRAKLGDALRGWTKTAVPAKRSR